MTNSVLNKMDHYNLEHVIYSEDNGLTFECFSSDDYYFVKLMLEETNTKAVVILY